ncbi:Hypothetical protein R9X50_00147600 [Acrodontium crateriforme]|uniref:Wax synthase domain-containing protein n=1 Tax=Acrodontium crateriforme TaxID=150365 RepID=A0AAQ3LZT2_9PEZI|nr:Hypothetical protein R9X50_00147600 [Acrodontium crateriforme]
MLPPGLNSPRQVVLYYDSVYDSLIESGQAYPFLYPWGGIGVYVVFIYLLIDHRHSVLLRRLRYVVFAFVCAFSCRSIATNKARMPSSAFGVGLISAFAILISYANLIASDAQSEFTRLERRRGKPNPNGSGLKLRYRAELAKTWHGRSGRLYWQSYPSSFIDRVDWAGDLFTSFRGTGWSFQIAQIPGLPRWAEIEISHKSDDDDDEGPVGHDESQKIIRGKSGIRRFTSRKALISNTITHMVIDYLALDVIKTLMNNDPYFWGYTSTTHCPVSIPSRLCTSHIFLKSYRLTLSLAGIYTALHFIFKLGPLIFAGLLGPKYLGVKGETWMNPADMFSDPHVISTQGLAGWWGTWWHQTFRLAFSAPTHTILSLLHIKPKTTMGKTITLFVAFILSGLLHASGSYTQLGRTQPIHGPMTFFTLQPIGIIAQQLGTAMLRHMGILGITPKPIKKIGNLIFVHVWFYFTAPLLVDDFAQGGIWLYEPIPISVLRGLGFGMGDDGWWCWFGGPGWRSGRSWFDTGIAF